MATSVSSNASASAWSLFLTRCLATRLSPETFSEYASQLSIESPLPPLPLSHLLLRPANDSPDAPPLDMRTPQYIVKLIKLNKIQAGSVLRALYRWSKWKIPVGIEQDGTAEARQWKLSYMGEETVMFALAKVVMDGVTPRDDTEAVELLRAVTVWAKLMSNMSLDSARSITGVDEVSSLERTNELSAVRVALGTLITSIAKNPVILSVLQRGSPIGLIKELAQVLTTFAPTILNSLPQIAQDIEIFRTQTLAPLEPVTREMNDANDEMSEIIGSALTLGMDSIPVVDLPVLNSRAGLYVYLNSLLVAKPIVDDDAILTYLHNRYQGDTQSTIVDLVAASFDILANAIFRKENAETTIVLRSFLINKIPLLISRVSTTLFPPLNAEYCITQALSNVDTNAFPTFSSMFDESSSGNVFGSDSVRQDFCFACCLHGLIAESSIERLLGEVPMQTLPAGGRYTKEDLVEQCLSDPSRLENLIEEIESMDGNVGAVCNALAEMIRRLCQSKDTIPLKTLCIHLARKPSSLDVMLLFERTSSLLKPLCELLDGWHHDEDLGEYQPVYEEFGGILLLVLAFVFRYSLSMADIGIRSHQSFVSKWFVRGAQARTMAELTEQEHAHLDVWIRALFNAEGGGLSDQPMAACTPQDFYLLVPTLFSQIVLASSKNHLSDDILKGGLEFLVDTFLLPSLIGAFIWLSNNAWEAHGNTNSLITILQTLILPAQISSEASTMLTSILSVTAKPLELSLRYLQSIEPSRQDIAPLSKALSTHLNFSRTGGAVHTELETWTSTQGGGLVAAVRHTMQQLIQWSLTPGVNVMPVSYTHRQVLTAIKMIGAKRLLGSMIEEVQQQHQDGSGSVALDVAVAIICSPDAATQPQQSLDSLMEDHNSPSQTVQRRLTLQEALKMAAETATTLHKSDVPKAEAIIRLWRRVEAQMLTETMLQNQNAMINQANMLDNLAAPSLHPSLSAQGGIGMNTAATGILDDAMAAAAVAGGDIMGMGDGMLLDGDDLLSGMDMKLEF